MNINIEKSVVDFANKYGISCDTVGEVVNDCIKDISNEDLLDGKLKGWVDGNGYTLVWEIVRIKNDYVCNIIDIYVEKAPSDINAEEAIIETILKKVV